MSKNKLNDKKQKNCISNCGPFPVIEDIFIEQAKIINEQIVSVSEYDHPPQGPERKYDCKNYETCLNLAAALNWDSFTCLNCNGHINEKLYWRAQAEIKKDNMTKMICELPMSKIKVGSILKTDNQG